MPISNILVAFNGTQTSQSALDLATRLATHHDAHLTGLIAQSLASVTAYGDAYMPPDLVGQLMRNQSETEQRIAKMFAAKLEKEGRSARSDFHIVRGAPNETYAAFARTYDLLVVGQKEGDMWDSQKEPNPDVVALMSGRAVLVTPKDTSDVKIGGDIVVAWDGTRAAARALAEAMVLVEEASRVMVLHIGTDDSEVRKPGRNVMEHLSRHGISAELRIEPKANRSVGEAIRDTAEAVGASCLVMGAYEHSRFSEAIFGGATRDVLDGIKVPVLMAH